MSDRLEDFVRQHREEFDLREPDPSVWLKINPANAPVVKSQRPLRWLRVAAVIAVIFAGSSVGIHYLTGGNSEADLYSEQIYMEMQETEAFYTRMVSERYKELKPFLASDPMANEMLTSDLEELDQVYLDLKNDLKDNVSNPEVIEAMVLNYRIKLEILEDLLNQLKEKENQDYGKDDSYSL
ncbi:MAG: hypothetical protein QNK35_13115 [Bacteroides sp.]|nr:hypothetical protein [Bacteroides sp.]